MESGAAGGGDEIPSFICSLGGRVVLRYRQMRRDETALDYTITTVDNVDFHVHKLYLSFFSDYFYALIHTSLDTGSAENIFLQTVTSQGLRAVLNFIYGEEDMQNLITADNISDVLAICTYLQMEDVLQHCVKFLKKELNQKTAGLFCKLSCIYSLQSVEKSTEEYVCKNFMDIVKTRGHLELLTDQMYTLLQSEIINAEENDIFISVLSWVAHNMSERRQYFEDMLSYVRFPFLDMIELLAGFINDCTELINSEVCRQMIKEAKEYERKPIHQQVLSQSPSSQIRHIPTMNIVCVPSECNSPAMSYMSKWRISVLDEGIDLEGQPRCYNPLHIPCVSNIMHGPAVTVYRNFLIACGGKGQHVDEVIAACSIFNPATFRWYSLAPMNQARAHFTLVGVGDFLYAMGGHDVEGTAVLEYNENDSYDDSDEYDENEEYSEPEEVISLETIPLDSIERYSFETNTWETQNGKFPFVHDHTLLNQVLGEMVYFIKGPCRSRHDNVSCAKLVCFSPSDCSFTSRATAPRSYSKPCSTVYDGKMYTYDSMYRGPGSLNVDSYDPATDQWTTIHEAASHSSLTKDYELFSRGKRLYLTKLDLIYGDFDLMTGESREFLCDDEGPNYLWWEQRMQYDGTHHHKVIMTLPRNRFIKHQVSVPIFAFCNINYTDTLSVFCKLIF